MIAPWIIDREIEEQRRKEQTRDRLWIEAPNAESCDAENVEQPAHRGVNIVSISPESENTIRI